MIDLMELTPEEARQFLDSFDMIVSDCDGVMWDLIPIHGVKEAVCELYKIGKQLNFVSNNGLRDFDRYDELLAGVGIQRTDDNFIHPSDTAKDYMVNHNFVGKKIYTIAPVQTNEAFRASGIQVVTGPNEYENDLRAILHGGKDDPEVEGVFIDADLQMNYLKIFKAVSILHRPEVPLIVGATDKITPIAGYSYPGPGYFLKMLTETTSKRPVILGKPSKYLRQVVKQRFHITDTRRVLFIGDSLDQDIAFGSLCDFQTLLVLSGCTTKDDVNKVSDELLVPEYITKSFADFTHIIQKAYKSRL